MKVCIHALGISMGGGAGHLQNFLRALSEDPGENTFHVLVRDPGLVNVKSNAIVIESPGRWVSHSPLARIFFDQLFLPLRLLRGKYDCLVSLANFGPFFSPVPHVLFQRNALHFWDGPSHQPLRPSWAERLRRLLIRFTVRGASIVVTPTRAMAQMMQEKLPAVPKNKYVVLPHGFDVQTPSSPAAKKRQFSGLKLLYVSHYSPHKAFEFLLEAAQELKKSRLDFRFYFTLGGPQEKGAVEKLTLQAKQLGVLENIEFLGQVPSREIGSVYRSADALVFPSLCESFGFPLIEAMGYGLPVIAADLGFCREICADAALYYPVGDKAKAAALMEKIADPRLREELSTLAARRIASRDWSWQRYAKDFKGLLSEARAR